MDEFIINSSEPPDVDPELLELATKALQAQERLHLAVKKRNKLHQSPTLLEGSCKTLDTLREMRSEVDGTAVMFEKIMVDEKVLQHIRQLILMHVPGSLTPEVKDKLQELITKSFQGLRGFLEQCRGQAVGMVSKKSKSSGKMRLRDGATLYEFCESFRLLQHACCTLAGTPLSISDPRSAGLSQTGQDAVDKLCQIYQEDHEVTKEDLLQAVLAWRGEIDQTMKGFTFSDAKLVDSQVGQWLASVRTPRDNVPRPLDVSIGELEKLKRLMVDVGGPVSQMQPEQILMVARAGSYLYGLSTPKSDVDYLVIYARPLQDVISATKRLSESVENRGPKLDIEYGAYEARLFCEMLWKGSVVIAELTFVDEVEYMSSAWKALISQRRLFMTERLILQYFGLVKNNMVMIQSGKHKDTPREGKIFYQIFHKLSCIKDLLHCRPPGVRVSGETRDFIMNIRRGPLEGDLSSEKLYELAKISMDQLKSELADRTSRLPENVDYNFLTNWLLSVRGWGR